jgi:hypothetical protein
MAKKSNKWGLDDDLLQRITNCIIDKHREDETAASKARYDRKRANTKLLLRNYRSLSVHCESAIYEASHMGDEMDLAEILELMSGNRRESFRIESIRESAARTRLIIEHVNEMLEHYHIFCERSTKPEDARRYRVIYDLYIADVTKTPDEIALIESIDPRTVYKDIDSAVERLTALIFGIDGLHLLKK